MIRPNEPTSEQPAVLRSSATGDHTQPLWREIVPGGAHGSFVMRRGTTLRMTDLDGGSNVSVLFYNDDEKLERYNMADTLKAQHTAFLTRGHVCYSDMGRILCSITEDTCGWHDTLCGMSNAALVESRYGKAHYQGYRNAMHRNARDGMLIELAKWGLGKRDIVANVNFFSKVTADTAGNLAFQQHHSKPGNFLDLRFEMNTLVVFAASQHPLDPASTYAHKPVELSAHRSSPQAVDDVCRNLCPENQRGFYNTERLFR